MNFLKVLKYIFLNVVFVLGIISSILAQPSLSLWKVDEEHLDDHSHGEAYLIECGSEYYVNHLGEGTYEDIIVSILNEGNEPLIFQMPLSLSSESSSTFTITQQPDKSTLEPGEESHFVVRYTAPTIYSSVNAQISIFSNDVENGECSLLFEVGEGACGNCPAFTQQFLPDDIGPFSTTTLEYTISNTAGGAINVTGLQFTNTLATDILVADPPRAMTDCTDGMITASAGGNSISFSNGRLSAGSSCTIRVDVTGSVPGMKTNTSGPLESSAGTGGSSSASLNINNGKVGIVKSFSPSSIPPGGVSELKIEMKNLTEGSISFFEVDDVLPLGMTFATPLVVSHNCTAGILETSTANGRSTITFYNGVIPTSDCYLKVNVTASDPGSYLNTAVVDAITYTSSAVLEVPVNFIVKSFTNDPVTPGDTVTLDFSIQNPSRAFMATAIAFDDVLNPLDSLTGLEPAEALPKSVCGGTLSFISSTLKFSGGSLAAEGNCNFSVKIKVPATAPQGSYTNTTTAITAMINGGGVTGNMASDVLVVSEAPVLTKSFTTDPIVSGQDVVLNFNLTNPSTSTATDISFTDEFSEIFKTATSVPADNSCMGTGVFVFDPLVDPGGSSTVPSQLTVSKITLTSGQSCSFSITLNSDDNAPGGVYNNTTSSVTATIGSSTVTGNPASDDITVIDPPSIEKDFEPISVNAGAMTSLKFEITHDVNAAFDATSISFTDDLDAALTGLVASGLPLNDVCGTGSVISGTSTLSFTGGTLSPGSNCIFFVPISVPMSATPGTYTNATSNLTSMINGVATTGDNAVGDLEVSGLELTKDFIDDPKIPGETGTLSFYINNSSSENATNISFEDDFRNVLSGLIATSIFPISNVCGVGSTLLYNSGNKTLTLANGSLTAGTSCSFDIEYQVPSGASNAIYTNTTSQLMADFGSTSVTLSPAIDDLQVNKNRLKIQKEFEDDPIALGGTVNLKFTIENLDQVNGASDLSFTDDLGAALSGLVAIGLPMNDVCGAGSMISGTDLLTFTDGILPAGEMCEFSVSVMAPLNATIGTYTNTTGTITGKINALDVEGLPASDDLTVSSVKFSKTIDYVSYSPDTIGLKFSLENLSPVLVDELAFNDILDNMIPGAVAINLPMTDVCGVGSMVSGTSTIEFTNGSLASMSSCEFTVQVSIPPGISSGTYTNSTSNLRSGFQNVSDPVMDSVFVYPDVASLNQISFGDPCSCSDTLNCDAGAVFYFHDTLTIPMTLTTTPGLSITISSATDFYTDVPCNGGSLVLATAGTAIPETVPGMSGVYKIEFWRPSGVVPSLSVQVNAMPPIMVPSGTFFPVCLESDCLSEPIPSASSWGLIALSLLLLIIGVVSMKEKVEMS